MTQTSTTASTTTDPRPAFGSAVETAVAAVAAVRPEQLAGRTPCTEYDVRALVGHLVAVLRRVAAVGRGEPPFSVSQVTTGVPVDGWAAAARAAAAEVRAVWSDDRLLDRELTLPFGRYPGAAALAAYTAELTTHTWDLAQATGQAPDWDERVLAVALPAAHRILPADVRGGPVPFGPVVPVPDDAPLVDRLVAWQGRDPRWTP
ncbi:TIGR03086 family metal-binding protein [Modestobacter marinus]|uniref:TIGR03086 family metal-binding protein n=1 Tax=Modestobacter marinus TaxID=477641 RepID=UPI001C9662C1|nr:TIGR03086 family metal-binding protein [Modestobacter marinus]